MRVSILAWRSPWTEEPDGLQSMGSHRVLHASWPKNQNIKQKHYNNKIINSITVKSSILMLLKSFIIKDID